MPFKIKHHLHLLQNEKRIFFKEKAFIFNNKEFPLLMVLKKTFNPEIE